MRGLVLALLLWPTVLPAVEPQEILADPALEARARDISDGLRCPVCRNESIDESHAEVARDIRLMVRERLVAGDSDDAIRAAVVARYGEYVLLRPTADGANLVLWLAGPAMLLGGLGLGLAVLRRRSAAQEELSLSPEEKSRLDDLLGG
ncbi:cytochrome c-type biogenesis protein CcmH [Rubellimicrobium rubrum]|uniref:Cytochrome c-type biogenesis protein n=1 Tax=Rubellimicrobium rubrum TaxID=2585369 RepID=A0A5C4MYS9_9RHOB|nr:cytochrome c-type biogenesis protein [Rubellimicrobium rubrum]TNC50814.1 cytochrome c-type biogenesis protein CcmH [Rubellimicrobium rubrum]